MTIKIDSYVLESNVHFPTDVNLLWDAARKCLALIAQLIALNGVSGWRKHQDWLKRIKVAFLKANKIMFRGGKNKEERLAEAVLEYLKLCWQLSEKIKDSKDDFRPLASESLFNKLLLQQLDYFEEMLDKHIDLVRRRVILKQNIPHEEKVFSLFEPYTEWVNKGKSPYRVELGLPIAVVSDQYGFVLHHRVMIKESDAQITIPIAEAILKWGDIYSISFDKGFWSKINYEALKPKVPLLVMPKKGKLTQKEFERENGKEFVKLRHQHAGVESDINALEHHGLNRCPDKGIKNFKRYVSLGILSLNLHRLGNILIAQDRARTRTADKKSNQTNRSKAA